VTEEHHVQVWRFRRYDIRAGQYVTSIGKATVEAIERFRAEPIAGSMEEVPQDSLDVNGIYTPPIVRMSPAARRRLERLKAQYENILQDEDHARLDGCSERIEMLSTILQQLEEKLALPTTAAARVDDSGAYVPAALRVKRLDEK
jgi:hypothetical protein